MLLVQTSDPNPLPLSWSRPLQLISMARDVLDTELTALVGESYNRAYGAMVQVQLLSELEEVIEYKLHPERRDMIRRAWWDRLQVSEWWGGVEWMWRFELPELQVSLD